MTYLVVFTDPFTLEEREALLSATELEEFANHTPAFTFEVQTLPGDQLAFDDSRECVRCGDQVAYLSSDDLCWGCIAEEDNGRA